MPLPIRSEIQAARRPRPLSVLIGPALAAGVAAAVWAMLLTAIL